jgi:hypothetical protein
MYGKYGLLHATWICMCSMHVENQPARECRDQSRECRDQSRGRRGQSMRISRVESRVERPCLVGRRSTDERRQTRRRSWACCRHGPLGLSSRFTQSLSPNATGSKVWWLVLSSGGGYSTVYLVMFSGARLFSGLRCLLQRWL